MKKITSSILTILGCLIFILVIIWNLDFGRGPLTLGVNFSQPQAQYLGLDWRKTYLAILDDLEVRNLRLQAYWSEIEKEPSQFNFADLDWQVQEAKKHQAKIIMVIGRRQPHWPECHSPAWTTFLSEKDTQKKILTMLEEVVKHYKKENSIVMWQVDNEPLVEWFGNCPKVDKEFINQEIALVKQLDLRPILITDSGELSWWYKAASLSDVFGTTVYRVVWNKSLGYLNYKYLLPPAFYSLKAKLAGIPLENSIISELQAEPWQKTDISLLSLEEQRKSFDADKFVANVEFAKRTGFSSAYLWGVEYWYWLKETKGDDSLWWVAKKILGNNSISK